MNRFQMLRCFVLMALRGREVPLQELVSEDGMETELQEMILELEGRMEKRAADASRASLIWEQFLTLTPVYDPASGWFNTENGYEEHYDYEEIYEGPPELEQKMDRARRRLDRLYHTVCKLQKILNPTDAWEGIPF